MNAPEVPEPLEELLASSSVPLTLTCPRLPDDPVIRANAAFLRMCEYNEDEVIGRNCRFLQGPKTKDRIRAEIRQGLSVSGDTQVMITNYRKSGEAFDNFLFIFPIMGGDGRALFFMGSQFEIPEVGQSSALMEHADALRSGIDTLNDERKKSRRQLIACGRLLGMSTRSLVMARIDASI